MKKFVKKISLLCLAAAFVLASCSSPSSGGSSNDNGGTGNGTGGGTGGGRAQVSGKIGKYGAPYVVGDIVFNDGSATPYAEIDARTENDMTTGKKIKENEQNAAIAVIFYVGTGLNSGSDTGSRTLGVGLKHDRDGLAWCASSSVDGYSINITTIQCTPYGDAGHLTFDGDKNGSNNYEQMEAFFRNK